MTTNLIVKEISSIALMFEQYPLVKQLNKTLSKRNYKLLLADMIDHGYRMAGVFDGDTCIGLSGFWISAKIYCGKYVEPDNVIIDKEHRSKGIGKMLLDWIEAEAIKAGCKTLMLDAYTKNTEAHRFYEREGFVITGHHFIKKIPEDRYPAQISRVKLNLHLQKVSNKHH